jgi:hypothetical protein
MNVKIANSLNQTSDSRLHAPEIVEETDTQALSDLLLDELRSQVGSEPSRAKTLVNRIALEVERICRKSDRIQTSGEIGSWQLTLARHRLSQVSIILSPGFKARSC